MCVDRNTSGIRLRVNADQLPRNCFLRHLPPLGGCRCLKSAVFLSFFSLFPSPLYPCYCYCYYYCYCYSRRVPPRFFSSISRAKSLSFFLSSSSAKASRHVERRTNRYGLCSAIVLLSTEKNREDSFNSCAITGNRRFRLVSSCYETLLLTLIMQNRIIHNVYPSFALFNEYIHGLEAMDRYLHGTTPEPILLPPLSINSHLWISDSTRNEIYLFIR